MNPVIVLILVISAASASEKHDKNPLHSFCQPCTNIFTVLKDLCNDPVLRSGVRGLCASITANYIFCDIVVAIASTYLNKTAPVVICERAFVCPMEGFFGLGHTEALFPSSLADHLAERK